MRNIPIRAQHQPRLSASRLRRVEQLARDTLVEQPHLIPREEFRACAAADHVDGPALIIDDLSEISLISEDQVFFQDRARMRAGDGDVIVSCSPPVPGYDDYCRDQLGLGNPEWLRATAPQNRLHVAEAAWEDRDVRRKLVHHIRRHDLQAIHPHMGTLPIWELAMLLSKKSHRQLSVLAPPPTVAQWANDKVQFTETVRRLFGDGQVPRTTSAWSLSMAAVRAKELATVSDVVGIKIPNSAGSKGNFVIPAADLAGKNLTAVEQRLREELNDHWDGQQPLLISEWESEVLCSPSVQLWLPPNRDCLPIVEGVFVQAVSGDNGEFVGNEPATLPHALTDEIVDRAWMLGRLFQLLGYVGRCSFDVILLGRSLTNSVMEFIECNGRWGGTSLPMTLMNRMFGDWKSQPYSSHVAQADGLRNLSFQQLLDSLSDHLYDHRTKTGRYILYNPGRMQSDAIGVIAIAPDWPAAHRAAFVEFPQLLQKAIAAHHANTCGVLC